MYNNKGIQNWYILKLVLCQYLTYNNDDLNFNLCLDCTGKLYLNLVVCKRKLKNVSKNKSVTRRFGLETKEIQSTSKEKS